ncbi:MAG: ABC transporter ATP-binding protein/permease [Nannocystaceae bacterium]|nr:ABC transporter ATP-binding protein/permease [Nannocystaceae bacterium]
MSDADESKLAAVGSAWSLLRRFWGFARPHQRWIWLGIAMIPMVAGMTALRPLLLKHAVDVEIPDGDAIGLRVLGIGFLVAVMAEFLCSAVQVYALQRGGHATINDLRRQVFAHVLRLPARFYDNNAIGSLLSRTTSDVEALSETLAFGVFTILTDVVMIGTIVVAMFVLDPVLTLVTLTVAPVLYIIVRYFGASLRRLQLEIRKSQAAQTGFLAEQLTGVTVVQLYGREQAALGEYARLGQRNLDATKKANVLDALLFALMDGISAFTIALMIYFAAPSVTGGGAITVGLLFAFVDYLQRVFGPIKEFSGKLATIQRASASLERIYGLLDEPTEPRAPAEAADPLAKWRGGLSVRDLHFRYKSDGPDVLRGISFDIAPGEVIAVVGRTGSGKSSLGRVLTRFYDGYRGHVTLDVGERTVELSEVPPERLRAHVLMVQQDVFLFNDDVAFNVSLGEDAIAADPSRIRGALSLVQADAAIAERGGLGFEIGERGTNLSAGEGQLLAFARVAAREPTLLILDEATASVDSLTEQKVQRAIEQLLRGRSVLVIAHRLSTVRRADRILVLAGGQVVESGHHDALMAKNGLYAELVRAGLDDEAGASGDGAQPAAP